jgi:hypothetical protein
MGFLSGIGKVFSGIKNVANKVGDIAGKVAEIGGKAVKILQAPEEAIGGFVKKAAGGLLNKLPFGLGKIAEPFVNKLIDKGLDFLSKGPLGGIFEFAKKLAPKVDQLADFAEVVSKKAKQVGGFELPGVAENLQNIFARSQADGMAERYAA